jgi:hypothetical protein
MAARDPLVRLVSWNEDQAKLRAAALKSAGIRIEAERVSASGLAAQFAGVSAVCIDLDRLPSHGREVAVALRKSKATRHIPIVLAGGLKEKVAKIRKELPDATYTDWSRAAAALRKAMKQGVPANPVAPPGHMERYAATPLVRKLGIAANMKVGLVAAPEGFEEILRDVPEGVEFANRASAETKLVIWFARSRAEVEREIEFMAARLAPAAGIWIAYPKQTSRFRSDLTQNDVRALALAAGLVDYKVCAIDADWTGLKFAHRKGKS